MLDNTIPLKWAIIRTNPEQDKPVIAFFYNEPKAANPHTANESPMGRLEADYTHWLQFEKLIRDGMERRAREGNTKIIVQFGVIEDPATLRDSDGSLLSNKPDHSILINALGPGHKE